MQNVGVPQADAWRIPKPLIATFLGAIDLIRTGTKHAITSVSRGGSGGSLAVSAHEVGHPGR